MILVLDPQEGGTYEMNVSDICTARDLPNLYGTGSFTIGDMTRIGIRYYDSVFGDNAGDTTFTLKGPY